MVIDTLIIFRDEFSQRNFFDWIKSHITGSLPPHRYKGELEITDTCIKFVGIDTKLEANSEFLIERYRIEEVYYGYDDVYTVFQTRGLGLGWAPVRIKFTNAGGQEIVAYFITGYTMWGSANRDFYNYLISWLS